jgi:DNA-directed RNA polymerase subunit M/transcription elongation factor TFIIS
MKFCPECESLLHYREKDGKLVHKCNGCNYISETNETLISQNSYLSNNNPTFGNKKNFIYDMTLPRTTKYICPNDDCITHANPNKKEAIFFNEGDSLKSIYICKECNTEWKY